MSNNEFYLEHDLLKIHCKMDFPGNMDPEKDKCPLLILIHGFTGWMDEEHIVGITEAANEAGTAVLRSDMYGHGKSDGAFKDHTILKWIDQMTTIIDYACHLPFASRLFLGGHSQGGLIAMLAGAIEQNRLDAILPFSPAVVIPEGARSGDILRVKFDPLNITDEIDLSTPDKKRVLSGNYARTAKLFSAELAMEHFDKPVLIIHGDEDMTVPVRHSIAAAPKYKNCTLKIVRGADHQYHGHMDEVRTEVKSFLQNLI